MANIKNVKNGPRRKTFLEDSQKPHVEVHVEYHFVETAPQSNPVTGAYIETFEFEDEYGEHARIFNAAPGEKFLTWRCRHPFVIIFHDILWSKHFEPTSRQSHYLYRKKGGGNKLVGVQSKPNPKSSRDESVLTLQIIPQPKSHGKTFYYTLIPDLVTEPNGNGMNLSSQSNGRGGITLSQ
jgi:hypothetical protein